MMNLVILHKHILPAHDRNALPPVSLDVIVLDGYMASKEKWDEITVSG